MYITRHTLNQAVKAHILSESQAQKLIEFIEQLPTQSPTYNMTNVLYYFGGLIAIGAMTLFMNLGWETFGGFGIFFLCLLYALLGLSLATTFKNKNLPIPSAICATFVICLTPLAIYGLQVGLGWWPSQHVYRDYHRLIEWHWIFMELGTLIIGLILAWIFQYPFMMMPIAFTLWYMSMDFTSMLTGNSFDFQLSAQVSMYFGMLILIMAFWVDIRSRKTLDFAFWLYLFGVMAFWFGLSSQYFGNELARLFYCAVNLILIAIGVLFMRRVFVVFGALGVIFYLGHLSWSIFKDSILFPVILTAIGFIFIYLGIIWQKHEKRWTHQFRTILPQSLRELLEAREI